MSGYDAILSHHDPVSQTASAAAVASVSPGGDLGHPGHVLAAPGAPHPPPLPHGVSGPWIPIIANVIEKDESNDEIKKKYFKTLLIYFYLVIS